MKTLLAVDGSNNSYEAVHALKYFARAEQLTLLHALNVPRPAYPMMLPKVAGSSIRLLNRSCGKTGSGCSIGFSPSSRCTQAPRRNTFESGLRQK